MVQEYRHQELPHRMLVILAHPDDESFAVGGTLAKFAKKGVRVILLCATRGEAGIAGIKPEEAGDIRELELRQAAKHLGIEVFFLGYQDGELSKTDPIALVNHVSSWMELVQPQVVLTFGPEGVSGHPDHVTVSKIVTQAYDQNYRIGVLLYISPSEATALGCGVTSTTTDDGNPVVSLDISAYKLEKVKAIQSHTSQNPGLIGCPESEVEKIPCHENYAIARDMKFDDDSVNWFDLEKNGNRADEMQS